VRRSHWFPAAVFGCCIAGLSPVFAAAGDDTPCAADLCRHSPVLVFRASGELVPPGQLLPDSRLRVSPASDQAAPGLLPAGLAPEAVYQWSEPRSGTMRSVVTAVDADGALAGVLLQDQAGGACRYLDRPQLVVAEDRYGRHPLITSDRPGLGVIVGEVPAWVPGSTIDWRAVPEIGRGFERTWQAQAHLPTVPQSDGVMFRYERTGSFRSSGRPGRGNSPHHWNLLAYALEAGAPAIMPACRPADGAGD